MKKVIIPVSGSNIPPLMTMGGTQEGKVVLSKPVQPISVKTLKSTSSPTKLNTQPLVLQMNPPKSNISNMRLVQTSTGKKLLLTNVVNVSRPSTSRQVLLVPKGNTQATNTSSPVSPVVAANAPRTIVLQTSASAPSSDGQSSAINQPLMLKVAGMNHPFTFKQSSQAPANSIKDEPDIMKPPVITVLSNSTASLTTTSTITKPVTSLGAASNPIMILNNGTTTFKVVGTPVPVKLNPKLQKIAPKAQFITGSFSPQLSLPPLKKFGVVQTVQSASPLKNGISTKPPAYLNIQVKEEPKDIPANESITVDGVCIKEEKEDQKELEDTFQEPPVIDPVLDVRIKEEPVDEQSELLAKDEQLRQVLGVSSSINVTPHPRFYIRTSEGKLVSISNEEAEALGLDHNDKVENNQKKLLNALTNVKTMGLLKSFNSEELNSKMKPVPTILIPDNVNVKDYVSRHVPPEAEKAAALMKTLSGKIVETSNKFALTPKSNTTIIGEFSESGRRYLRIRIETEAQEQDDRIELREHLRAHERENWHETPDGDLIPIIRDNESEPSVGVDDTMENIMESEYIHSGKSVITSEESAEEIQVEVELDPDDPMENDDIAYDEDEDSEYEEHELQIEESDPLA
ncbi:hypothetical protein Hamer_G006738 [Homarus americanus]|uniref:Uncharacterized protein n=1 Tax=Homarus americanus TaxID=6706 RepID=A0A8J5MMC5_HOMAM|nr:hypothetical protein Hamer_G006738 [Homarus americanus]